MRRRRNGYVLLMTIVLIAVAALLLAGMVRQGLLLAVEAREAQEDLQRRWGMLSCRQAILKQAEHILKQQTDREKHTDSSAGTAGKSVRLVLGGMEFDLRLADEGAKINLNTIYHRQGTEGVYRLIRENQSTQETLPVRLRPYRTDSSRADYPAFDSWGQVFVAERSEKSNSMAERVAVATTELTCWGDGRLNLEHASDRAVECIGRLAVGSRVIRQLLEAKAEYFNARKIENHKSAGTASVGKAVSVGGQASPSAESSEKSDEAQSHWLSDLLDRLSLRVTERQQIEQLMSDRSTCHSLWIAIHTKERSWYSFCVADSAVRTLEKGWSCYW